MLDPVVVGKAQQVVRALKAANLNVVTAESCTGGAVATAITSIAGASDVFQLGFVTYSNAAKRAQLGVEAAVLESQGAVSEPVAKQMAEGALAGADGSDLSVAITGIAGPGGGSTGKPVGLVYIATARRGTAAHVQRFLFTQLDRAGVRQAAALAALDMVLEAIGDYERPTL
jgi:nicotinamide-nucleotide amidase